MLCYWIILLSKYDLFIIPIEFNPITHLHGDYLSPVHVLCAWALTGTGSNLHIQCILRVKWTERFVFEQVEGPVDWVFAAAEHEFVPAGSRDELLYDLDTHGVIAGVEPERAPVHVQTHLVGDLTAPLPELLAVGLVLLDDHVENIEEAVKVKVTLVRGHGSEILLGRQKVI
jgi:hypothetical protein